MKSTILITGVAGGIGRALAAEFTKAGYVVVGTVHENRPSDLPCAHVLHVDLARTITDETYAAEVFGQIRTILAGRELIALINNAAAQILARTENLTRKDWQRTLNVNLLAPFFWTQALLPELEKARGCVINIGSIHARLTKRDFCAYATSKAGLAGMTRAMAVDLGGRVRVNAIEPAAIETDMLKAGFKDDPQGFENLGRYHPSGHIGKPKDLARFVRMVVEVDDGFLNGAILGFDGGISGCLYDPG